MNGGENLANKLVTVAAIILVAVIVASISSVIAKYLIQSNEVTGIVNPQPTPTPTPTPPPATMALTIDPDTITAGESFLLTATLSDSANGLTVNFYQGSIESGVLMGASTTSNGVAAYTVSGLSAGTYTFYAECDHP
jgi:hypothetical protein